VEGGRRRVPRHPHPRLRRLLRLSGQLAAEGCKDGERGGVDGRPDLADVRHRRRDVGVVYRPRQRGAHQPGGDHTDAGPA